MVLSCIGTYLFANKRADYDSLADEAIRIAKKFEKYINEEDDES